MNMNFQNGMGGGFNNPMMNNQMNQMNNPMNLMNQMNMMNQMNIMQGMGTVAGMGNMGNMGNMGMMNPSIIQQQQEMMNNYMQQQQMLINQQNMQNMLNQANNQQQFNQNFMQQQQIINNNPNMNNSPNSDFITILFKLQITNGPDREPYSIQCTLNDKVSDVIKQFRNKANDFDFQHEKFIFNAKRLCETLTVAEAGMSNNSIVYVINDKDLKGGF